jgi:CDP-diacylglycerol--serine O-phosphatidyltransferase
MIRQFLNPPNWFSAASLFCGLYAILLAGGARGEVNAFYQAGLFVFYAGLFDALDGRVARLTGTGSAFGVQLDSLIDVVSFGVAPACIVYFWKLHELGPIGVVGAFWFMLCGAFRLARFNCMADGKVHTFAPGSTITVTGGTLAALVMWQAAGGDGLEIPGRTLLVVSGLMGLLMVSSIPYRTMKSLRRNKRTLATVVLLAGGFVYMGVRYDISTVLAAFGTLALVSGPVEYAFFFPARRRERRRAQPQAVPAGSAGGDEGGAA